MDKFEQMFDLLLNEDKAGAVELFHEVVVEQGRNIYKEIAMEAGLSESEDEDMEGDELEESADCKEYDGQNPGMKQEKADLKEDEMSELSDEVEDEEEGAGDDMEADDSEEMPAGDEDFGDDEGEEEGDVEARLDDLEAAMAEIIANMDAEGEGDMEMDMDSDMDADVDADMGGDEFEGGVEDDEAFQPGM